MKYKSFNGHIVCKPFPSSSVEKKTTGLALVQQQVSLTKLEVIMDSHDPGAFASGQQQIVVSKGNSVYVRGQAYTLPWARVVLKVEGIDEQFILVPSGEVIFVSCCQEVTDK
jgi:hypothetical protein